MQTDTSHIKTQDIKTPRSIRFSDKEWAKVQRSADALEMKPTGFVRARALADDIADVRRVAHGEAERHKEFARMLATLGNSRLSQNLNQIARAINTGSLVLSPDVIAQINEACADIRWIRKNLMQALGQRK